MKQIFVTRVIHFKMQRSINEYLPIFNYIGKQPSWFADQIKSIQLHVPAVRLIPWVKTWHRAGTFCGGAGCRSCRTPVLPQRQSLTEAACTRRPQLLFSYSLTGYPICHWCQHEMGPLYPSWLWPNFILCRDTSDRPKLSGFSANRATLDGYETCRL